MTGVYATVEKQRKPFGGADPEVVPTFGTHLQAFVDCLAPDNLSAVIALLPQAFRPDAFLTVLDWFSFERRFLSCEPSHESETKVPRGQLSEATYLPNLNA